MTTEATSVTEATSATQAGSVSEAAIVTVVANEVGDVFLSLRRELGIIQDVRLVGSPNVCGEADRPSGDGEDCSISR